MNCRHQGFHTVTSSYDRRRRVLIYFRCCDDCGTRLGEVGRVDYEPRFDPNGNDRYLSIAGSATDAPALAGAGRIGR